MKTSELLEEALKLLWDGKDHPVPEDKHVNICNAITGTMRDVEILLRPRAYAEAMGKVREALGGHIFMEALLAAEGRIPTWMTDPTKVPPDLAPLVQEARRALMVELLTALDWAGD